MLAALVCVGLIFGCGDKKDPDKKVQDKKVQDKKVQTGPGPKDVALAVLKAMETGDGEAMVSCYDCSDEDKAFMKQFTPIGANMHAFATAGAKAYGKDAWMAAAKKAEMEDIAVSPFPDFTDADKKMKCTVEGDKATCTLEGMDEPLKLVKKDGKWVALDDSLPPESERKKMLVPMTAMSKAMDAVQGKIGQTGVTADKIFEELIQAVAKAMGAPGNE